MSGQAAYAFCNRAAGRVFRLGWDAAVLVARRRVEGELLERALVGQEEIYERDPDTGCVRRTRIHNGTTMAMLTRLDRMASRTSDVPADTAMAQIVAQDFERFLDMVEAGGGGAEAMLFLKARDGALVPMAGFDAAEFAKHYQLSRNSADIDDDDMEEEPPAVDEPDLTPEEAAAKMSVWFCEYAQDWRTNFRRRKVFSQPRTASLVKMAMNGLSMMTRSYTIAISLRRKLRPCVQLAKPRGGSGSGCRRRPMISRRGAETRRTGGGAIIQCKHCVILAKGHQIGPPPEVQASSGGRCNLMPIHGLT